MKFSLLTTVLGVALSASIAYAQSPLIFDEVVDEAITAYAEQITVTQPAIVVPTVVEVDVSGLVPSHGQVVVFERETGQFIASRLERSVVSTLPQWQIETTPQSTQSPNWLVDDNRQTAVDFPVGESGLNTVTFRLESDVPVTTSELSLQLAQYVALPLTVEIQAEVAGQLVTLVAKRSMTSQIVRFPEVMAQAFVVTLTYIQPLRITELNFLLSNLTQTTNQTVRFLAQPENTYDIYLNPDRPVTIATTEGGNLSLDEGVLQVGTSPVRPSPYYTQADVDNDQVPDLFDNCVQVYNPDQIDIDGNGRGDACDDFDRDGVINSLDNCINHPNRDQSDEDGDGIGDVCDEEESRFTERNAWVPWVGMGTAAIVIIILFSVVVYYGRPEQQE